MNALIPYLFEISPVRVSIVDGEPWFVATDVCSILDIRNSRDAVSRLEEDEKGVAITDTLGGPQELSIVSESGLYALIFRSRKPAAVAFRKWVTSEVIPSIRKTGRYQQPEAPEQHIVIEQTEPVPLSDYVQARIDAAKWRDAEQKRWERFQRRQGTPLDAEKMALLRRLKADGATLEELAALVDRMPEHLEWMLSVPGFFPPRSGNA